MKPSFTIFRVRNGWIVQTYSGSSGFSGSDPQDRETTYVFTAVSELAKFLVANIQ